MKYKFSYFAIILEIIVSLVMGSLIIYGGIYILKGDISNAVPGNMRLKLVCYFLLFFPYFVYLPEQINKCVILLNNTVKFISFRFKRPQKCITLTVKYEDIYKIQKYKLPIIGTYKIKIFTKNFNKSIVLSVFFKKHKEMFIMLYENVKKANPDVEIIDNF